MINGKLNFGIVKTLRKERDMTRTQLCKISGIPLTTLHDLEEGITTNPRLLTLIAVADAFQLDLSGFIALLQDKEGIRTGEIFDFMGMVSEKRDLMDKQVLDVCCGSKMFWFKKSNPHAIFMDNRVLHENLCDGRKLRVEPDIVGDFRNIPFNDNTFHMVVFDPPHLLKVGENSWLAKKYGRLSKNWTEDLKQGFSECMRVLKLYGTLIFKWNEQQIKLGEILEVIEYEPLFGNKRSNTHWLVFMKEKI